MKKLPAYLCEKQVILFILFLFSASQCAYPQSQTATSDVQDYPLVTVPSTEVRSIYSKVLDQEMILYIKLPAGYKTETQKIYPCWYGTDANRAFPMVANMLSTLEVPVVAGPEIVLVGIAYKINDMADWMAWRTRDLTPTNVPATDKYWADVFLKMTGRQTEIRSGGAAKFLEFIAREVIPFVESNYRVSSSGRAIGGYSYGGLFSLYVLFRQPELFSIYFAGSPSIRYDYGALYTYEKEYASSHNDMNAALFMTAGGAEDTAMVNNVNRMAALLESRKYPGLKVTTQVFPDETHQTCVPAAFMRAFSVLYKR